LKQRRGIIDLLVSYRRIAFDTNTCIYFLTDQPRDHAQMARELIVKAAAGELEVQLAGVVVLELLVHPYRSGDPRELAAIRRFTREQPGITTMPITEHVMHVAAELRAHVPWKTPDALVVASAIVNGCEAIVGNDGQFAKLGELQRLQMLSLRRSSGDLPIYVHMDNYTEGA
jgi:predicted nucleic acid-binding protein